MIDWLIDQNAEEDEKEELSNKFKLVKEGYETLSDPVKKQIYDTGTLDIIILDQTLVCTITPPPLGLYRISGLF